MPSGDRHHPGPGSTSSRYPGTFLLALREAAGQLGWSIHGWRGNLLECIDDEGNEHVVGLDNLYRRARQTTQREKWPDLIADFLRTVAVAGSGANLPEDLASVAENLLVRLGGKPGKLPENADVWSQPLADTDLVINLVVDYPDRMCYVPGKLIEGSGRPGDEWLRRALANLRARTAADCLPIVDEDTGIRLCSAADSYDSSRALILDALLPEAESDGCFVAVPARDQLLVLVVDRESLRHVHLLKGYAEKQYQSTPYPLSDQVYWVRRGAWQVFPIEIKGETVNVQPPEGFVELLKRLVPEEGIQDMDADGSA